jgi:hypothetical protein
MSQKFEQELFKMIETLYQQLEARHPSLSKRELWLLTKHKWINALKDAQQFERK